MPQTRYFRICGLTVGSEIDLPGVSPVDPRLADVSLCRAPVPDGLEAPIREGKVWAFDEARFLLRLDGIGRLLVTGGQTMEIDTPGGGDEADFLPFVMGTGFGALLIQRGALVLHASAVSFEGRAYVFSGRSGIGKSTIAGALCRDGASFVTDDLCAVAIADGRPVVWPDGRRLKLLDDAIDTLSLSERRHGLVRSGVRKHYVEPLARGTDAAVPVAAIYVLSDQRLPGEAGIQPLALVDAAQALQLQRYRPHLTIAMGRHQEQLTLTAAVLGHSPVFRLTLPRDLSRLSTTVAELRAHRQELPPGPR